MSRRFLSLLVLFAFAAIAAGADSPFEKHGRLRVARSGTYLEHADGTPFFVLADTCWTGPALSSEADWAVYLADRKKKGFTAIQFNMVSPWRCAPTDAEGHPSYTIRDGKLIPDEAFYRRLDARLKAINDAGLLAVPVLCWAHKKGDAGKELTEPQILDLVKFEVERYKNAHVLWILAGDNQYTTDTDMWKRIGRAVFGTEHPNPVTTHPTGENFPWRNWESESWLTVLGYQSGHGDSAKTWEWLLHGPPARYGQRKEFTRPIINLEPPYEGHNGYTSKQPHSDTSTRRAVYWSLLVHPPAGVTYGGHGVWSWHDRPGKGPIDHESSGVAKVWREALDLPGATQMGYVRKFFEAIPWTTLRPDPDFLRQDRTKTDPLKTVVAATGQDGGQPFHVIYFPPGATVAIQLHVRGLAGSVRWYNPRSGVWLDRSPKGLLTPPDENDWLLVVKP